MRFRFVVASRNLVGRAIRVGLASLLLALAAHGQQRFQSWEGEDAGDLLGEWHGRTILSDVDGDAVPDVAVASRWHDSSPASPDDGRVYLYSGRTGAKIHQWDGESAHSLFGHAIADAGDLDGDGVPELVVGAKGFGSSTGQGRGRVYVYSCSAAKSFALVYAAWEGEEDGDVFGQDVASIGDADFDGVPDIAVGAYQAPNAAQHGSAYLYSGATGDLIRSWGGQPGDELGGVVAAAGDFNLDGRADVAIGCFQRFTNPPGSGKVIIVSADSGTPLREHVGSAAGDLFAYAFECGDVDGDGITDLGVGSLENTYAGAVYVYSGRTGLVAPHHEWHGSTDGGQFGYEGGSAAGDVNRDGYADVLVGAIVDPPSAGGSATGATYLYSGRNGRLLRSWFGESTLDHFGGTRGTARDCNGDGIADFLVVATAFDGDSGNRANSGGAWLIAGNDLFLDAAPSLPTAGQQLVLTTRGGIPFNFSLLVLVGLDGSGLFQLLTPVIALDAHGESALSGTVPVGVGGISATLRAYAIGATGRLIDSNDEVVDFQ